MAHDLATLRRQRGYSGTKCDVSWAEPQIPCDGSSAVFTTPKKRVTLRPRQAPGISSNRCFLFRLPLIVERRRLLHYCSEAQSLQQRCGPRLRPAPFTLQEAPSFAWRTRRHFGENYYRKKVRNSYSRDCLRSWFSSEVNKASRFWGSENIASSITIMPSVVSRTVASTER